MLKRIRELYRLFRRDILLNFEEWVYQNIIRENQLYKKIKKVKKGGADHDYSE